ncbi:hypothetical protein [Mycetohabitans endofungorum]|uniref:Lipoprotein n=1 Tax=Mycetohabitans endofungorum TaxID=417203 RepID=A0A2P5K8F0_9BURK|nr:hypothetical protein [Mycetohabitans endofungorum]PPB83001.1 hypothetical protein B0O95_11161 [Mycetohabitans endofungorum]
MTSLLNALRTLATGVLLALAAAMACAQDGPPKVRWDVEVVQDGRSVDHFGATTTVGQAKSETHKRSVVHEVGCQNQPVASVELSRTLTVSPTHVDDGKAVLSLDVQEIFEDTRAAQTAEGCALPPQPRRVTAVHPGLLVPPGRTVSWKLVDHDPQLIYRVQASIVEQ